MTTTALSWGSLAHLPTRTRDNFWIVVWQVIDGEFKVIIHAGNRRRPVEFLESVATVMVRLDH